MNESIFLRYRRGGIDIPVTAFSPREGIEFAGETSASRLGVTFRMTPDAIAENALRRVRQVEDWEAREFRLAHSVEDGGIRLRGGGTRNPGASLPAGGYRVQVGLADTKLMDTVFDIRIPQNGETVITVEEKVERRLVFNPDPGFEPATFGLLASADSGLDGMPVIDWLQDPLRRIARKACLLNVMAKLRARGLTPHVESVNFATIDRIYTRVSASLFNQLRADSHFGRDSGPLDSTHHDMARKQLGDDRSAYDLVSFREDTPRRSLQIIVAQPKSSDLPSFAEMDIDLANPKVDAVSLAVHIGELLDSGRTDHVALFDRLRKDNDVSDFLYYSLERAKAAGE